MNLNNPNDPVTVTNLPFDANGNLIAVAVAAARRRVRRRHRLSGAADGAGAGPLLVLRDREAHEGTEKN